VCYLSEEAAVEYKIRYFVTIPQVERIFRDAVR